MVAVMFGYNTVGFNRWTNGIVALLVAAASIGAAACRRELTPEQRAQWHKDSLRYLDALAQWHRDSTYVDSIIRTGGADSILALYRASLQAEHPDAFAQRFRCEFERMARLYGTPLAAEIEARAKQRAVGELTDSALSAANVRQSAIVAVQLGGRACGVPDTVGPGADTVSFHDIGRPEPPRRPQ